MAVLGGERVGHYLRVLETLERSTDTMIGIVECSSQEEVPH